MSAKSRNSKVAGCALGGAASGASIGTAILPGWGTAIGAAGGAIVGGVGGYMADQADEEEMQNDPEYQAAKRKERSAALMSAALGRAFSGLRPKTMQGAMSHGI